ncbi:hypothetical protein LTR53_000596 [Teratosphaeriaceae sp. CCFEE 6253]|nr:hypothetical protein LTR53_000596 [Teratosphaeriaceae sp. CCFEE 6253]
MGDRDEDGERHGFPDSVLGQMQMGHDKYLRGLHEGDGRCQQDLASEMKESPGGDNLFVSFKKFIDSHLGSVADSLTRFPSNVAQLRAKMQQERERREQEELDRWTRWTGLEDTPDHGQMLKDRLPEQDRQQAVDAALMLLREARDRNSHVAFDKIKALFTDSPAGALDAFASPMLSPGGACYYQQDSGYNAPSTVIFRSDSFNHRWLSIDWFKRSPYSPINLEHHPDLLDTSGKWRAAFEDLLNAALDKPMTSRDQVGFRPPHGVPHSTRNAPGLDWMLSLQCRGVLPPQLPLLYGQRSPAFALTNEHLENPASSVLGSADVRQLIDEISTPAPSAQGHTRDHPWDDLQEQLVSSQERDEQDRLLLAQYEAEFAHYDQLDEGLERSKRWTGAAQLSEPAASPAPEVGRSAAELTEVLLHKNLRGLEGEILRAIREGDADTVSRGLEAWDALLGGVSALPTQDRLRRCPAFQEANASHNVPRKSPMSLGEPSDEHTKDTEALCQRMPEPSSHGSAPEGQWTRRSPYAALNELKKAVERLEQERDALELDDADDADLPLPHVAPAKTPTTTTAALPPKVDVLSSLTTTHTTRLPDGTVTTKVILKQRFADGREEMDEKVHTYQDPPNAPQPKKQLREDAGKNGGWFWS